MLNFHSEIYVRSVLYKLDATNRANVMQTK